MKRTKNSFEGIAIDDYDAILIATPDAMRRAFAQLGNIMPNKFIQVWEKFDMISETLQTLKREGLSLEEETKRIQRFVEFGSELASSIRQSNPEDIVM